MCKFFFLLGWDRFISLVIKFSRKGLNIFITCLRVKDINVVELYGKISLDFWFIIWRKLFRWVFRFVFNFVWRRNVFLFYKLLRIWKLLFKYSLVWLWFEDGIFEFIYLNKYS